MRTGLRHDAHLAVMVSPSHQVLAEKQYTDRSIACWRYLLEETARDPEAPQHLSHGPIRLDPAHQFVVLSCEHLVPPFMPVVGREPRDGFDGGFEVVEVSTRVAAKNRPGAGSFCSEQAVIHAENSQLKVQGLGRIVAGIEIESPNLFIEGALAAPYRPGTETTHLVGNGAAAMRYHELQCRKIIENRAIEERDDGNALFIDELERVRLARITGTGGMNQCGDVEFD